MTGLSKHIELRLNRFVRTEVHLGGRAVCSFHVCGVTGFSLAVVVAMLLVARLGLSGWVTLALAASGALTFLALAMTVKVFTGEEKLIYYHHEIAVVAVSAALLHDLGVPPASYLDVTVLGVGLMLMCGRIGCLMVGCCHGRPCAWGVRYRREHAEAGFLGCYVGVTLFPVQLVEALVLFGVLSVNVFFILTRAPGTALAWYVSAYAILRFAMEFLRGDPDRRTLAGFTEAQWTSLVLCAAAGFVFPTCWAVAALLALWMLALTATRAFGRTPLHRLLHHRHVREVAEALERARKQGLRVESTSLGVHLSTGEIQETGGPVCHYALSRRGAPLNAPAAEVLATLILRLRHPAAEQTKLIAGGSGVFHLVTPANRTRPLE